MAKFYPIRDLIDSAIALDVANPNFAISDKETLLKEAAIKLGTLDYYRFSSYWIARNIVITN